MISEKDDCLGYMIQRERERTKRPRMLEKTANYFRDEFSRIPERIRISFSDGTTAVYDLHTEQPAPLIRKNIEIIRKMQIGYMPRRRRRRK